MMETELAKVDGMKMNIEQHKFMIESSS